MKSLKNGHLIVNCTATQSVKPHEDMTGASLDSGLTTQDAVTRWHLRIEKHKPSITPLELYRGIGFTSIVLSQKYIKPENTFIVSIGQGLVCATRRIVPYDLSIQADHRNSLLNVVTAEKFSPANWWAMFNEKLYGSRTPLASLYQQGDKLGNPFIVACTGAFLKMIINDLLAISTEDSVDQRLRIITNSLANIPSQLKRFVIKYDARLDKISFGNRNDRGQRAGLHLLDLLSKDEDLLHASVSGVQATVDEALGEIAVPPVAGYSEVNQGVKDLAAYLSDNEDTYRGLVPDVVYNTMYAAGTTSVTSREFRMAWRSVFGIVSSPAPSKKGEELTASAAVEAMKKVSGSFTIASGSVSFADEAAALEALGLFTDTLRQVNPQATFSSTDVHAWAHQYFQNLGQPVPKQLEKVVHVALLVRDYKGQLEIELIPTSAGQQKKVYKLAERSES